MKMFNCYVPRSEYARAKDKSIIIFNILRKRDLESHDIVIERMIARRVREEYKRNHGIKSVLSILEEYLQEVKEQA